jgi:hypothetical protein
MLCENRDSQRNETSAKVLCLDKVYRYLSKLQRPVETLNYTHVLKDGRPTGWHDGERCENEEKGMLSICLEQRHVEEVERILEAQGLWGCHRLSSRAGQSCHGIHLHEHKSQPVSLICT